MKKVYIYNIMYACVGMMLAACTADSIATGGGTPVTRTDNEAVSFSTEISHESATRATTGLISDTDGLKEVSEGFGVFAYLTDAAQFNTADFKDKNNLTTKSFSNFFMQNQQVKWDNSYQDTKGVWQKDWVYSPLKYWPNYTDNVDASDGGTTPGPRYLSFFAYAPWVDASTKPTEGVINYVRGDDRTPHVIYKIGAADQQVDLLWANAIDAKRNGNGLISVGRNYNDTKDSLYFQKVPLEFKHALSAIDIYVQRVYDEPAYTGKIPAAVLYPTIYISKLELASKALAADGKNGLQKSGKLSLIDGKWSDPEAPNAWAAADEVKIPYDESMINDTIRGTANTTEEFIRDIELDKWKWVLDTHRTWDDENEKWIDNPNNYEWVDATTIPENELTADPGRWKNAYGLSEDERHFFRNNYTQLFIPRKVTLIPTLTYSMVVRDDNLQLNYLTDNDGHRYNRILNEVKGNSVTLDLVAGKRYSLLIRVGVEHITFELLQITDWDFPMRFDPSVVTKFQEESIGKVVNEE